jgi:hypothetical protein
MCGPSLCAKTIPSKDVLYKSSEHLSVSDSNDPLDYKLGRDMLQPEIYPENFPDLPKLELLKKQADAIGQTHKFYRAPQTTRFESGPNNVGVEMNASTLTGMDATGVNHGTKSSTLVNYLADAWSWGTEMYEHFVF